MNKKYLFTPGPTTVPPECLLAMARPIIHHRTSEYREIFTEVRENLKYVFRTENEVLTFTSSGTGAMEAAVANFLSRGDRVLVVKGGKFGERFAEIAAAYGVEVTAIDVEWGKAVNPDVIRSHLGNDVKAVYTTLCETSTGVANDIQKIAEVVSASPAVLVVDAISGLGAMELETDKWRVDVVISGSQKGLMIPPGLSFVSVGKKAWELVDKSDLPKYYFDFKKVKKAQEQSDSAFTPAISLIIGLQESLRMLKEERIENVISRHGRLAGATREAMKSLGLELFAEVPADAVTAVKVPAGMDGAAFVKHLRGKGVSIAGGQAHLKGKIFRLAHLGYMDMFDILQMISAVEVGLSEVGYEVEFGKGVSAAEEVFTKGFRKP
jgi:aspartate aminotransferase-like enzyme